MSSFDKLHKPFGNRMLLVSLGKSINYTIKLSTLDNVVSRWSLQKLWAIRLYSRSRLPSFFLLGVSNSTSRFEVDFSVWFVCIFLSYLSWWLLLLLGFFLLMLFKLKNKQTYKQKSLVFFQVSIMMYKARKGIAPILTTITRRTICKSQLLLNASESRSWRAIN